MSFISQSQSISPFSVSHHVAARRRQLAHRAGRFIPRGAMLGLAAALLFAPLTTSAQTLTAQQQLAFDIFKELVEINTVTATGDTLRLAEAAAARLRAGGFSDADVRVLSPAPRKGNLVARLRGSGAQKPMLVLGHIDVVEARREDWSTDPFKLVEADGYFYGRGTGDNKYMVSALIANLIRYKKEGYQPDRDIILALETDEEILDQNSMGIRWLLKNHRELIDAEFALNEGGGVGLKAGKPVRVSLQTSEKVSMTFRLETQDRGGHSSVPRKENAIYQLSEGLGRLAKFDFPFKLNATTRTFFERAASLENQQTAADMKAIAANAPEAPQALTRLSANPAFNAQLRTTCVATLLEGGHAVNALPQVARATVNCRALPGESADDVRATLVRTLADDKISVTLLGAPVPSPPSDLRPDIMQAVEKLAGEFWPGAPIIPVMSAGATDGSFLRNAGIPTYGHSGLAGDVDDNRIHGRDERILVKSFYEGNEYLYRLVKALAGGK